MHAEGNDDLLFINPTCTQSYYACEVRFLHIYLPTVQETNEQFQGKPKKGFTLHLCSQWAPRLRQFFVGWSAYVDTLKITCANVKHTNEIGSLSIIK